ncbi:hypothetical protein EYC84_010593 [Monilinia fructicola]|uniref:Uncharacterized protein n=1 Tax=Monilinia fructicola TaxID=38448 RepID=A0A5M9JAC8_MONFR|nr:hypothetical protein EYC84_010593 [Monilinia fructicola]
MQSPTISCDSRMDPNHVHIVPDMTTYEALSHVPLGHTIPRKPVNTPASPRYNGPQSQVAARKEVPGLRSTPREEVPASESRRVPENSNGPPRNTYKEKGSGCGCLIM